MRREYTVATTSMRPAVSICGCTEATRTSAGSVSSNRLNRSVHENARRSMRTLASRAAACSCDTSSAFNCCRIAIACWRRPLACASPRLGPARELGIAPVEGQDLRDVEGGEGGHDQHRGRDAQAYRPIVVERPRREVGAQHRYAALRSRSRMPTSGASASSTSGRRADAIEQRRRRARIDRLDLEAEPLLQVAAQAAGAAVAHAVASDPAAREQHPREAGAFQAILVVHRRLVHHVGQRPFRLLGAVAEEDAGRRRASPPAWCRWAWHAPAASRRRARSGSASTPLMTLKVARSTSPACSPAAAHTASYCAMTSLPGDGDDELAAALGRHAAGR